MTKCLLVAIMVISTSPPHLLAARNPGDPLRPGFNLFSPQQDIQLGQEAAKQVTQKSQPVQNQFLQDYVNRLGQRFAQQPEARASGFPFQFTVLNDPQVNAFALPGGPMFIYTGLLKTVDNEGELAGVMAHEMSHVILRHGTHEATKQQFISLPAALAGNLAGSSGGLLGQLTQLGIGLGANSVLLKFSRTAESEADALGAHLMAEAGYNPIEMAHLFQKLESEGGSRTPQFLSDHPSPGNRIQAIEAEMRTLPPRQYGYQTGDFQRVKAQLGSLPAPPQAGTFRSAPAAVPAGYASSGYRPLQTRRFSASVPANWQSDASMNSDAATVAPQGGIVQGQNGRGQVGFGGILSYLPDDHLSGDLRQETNDLISHLHSQNPNLRVSSGAQTVKVDGYNGLITQMTSDSPFGGEESDQLLTVGTERGLFYLVFVAPAAQARAAQPVFQEMVRTLKFVR
jgi:beta-barrel assembly-enhancing protease